MFSIPVTLESIASLVYISIDALPPCVIIERFSNLNTAQGLCPESIPAGSLVPNSASIGMLVTSVFAANWQIYALGHK